MIAGSDAWNPARTPPRLVTLAGADHEGEGVTRIAATVTTELLEREAPLRALDAALAEATRGRGSAVLISGEPGIGKSALVSRFASEHAGATRVLVGICDDLAIPRPLGAFRDLADDLPEPLAEALWDGRSPGEFATLLVRELRRGAGPTVLVVEDVHWADQATTDTLTVVARRLSELPVVLLLTVRPGELQPDHPLRSAIDAMQRSTMRHIELVPLSRAAVAQLAGDDAERIYELSRGNPFFVTELLAHGADPFPPSLANAVLGRVARLEPDARQLLELVSVVPGRVPAAVLDRVEPDWGTPAAAAERRQLLTTEKRHVRFRHELTRAAIHSSLPPARRRRLHRCILAALLELDADPADVVHHAEAAGETDVVAEHALAAARRAVASGANRESYAHYRRAVELAADRLPDAELLTVLVGFAHSAWLTGHLEEAVTAASRASELADHLDDPVARGRCLRLRAHLHWFRGDGQAAWRDACAGVHSLEAAGPSRELAHSYAQSSELSMLAGRTDDTVWFGQRALRLAGDDAAVRAQALAAIGAVRMQRDLDEVTPLLDALEVALTSQQHDQVVFTLVSLAYTHLQWVRPEPARIHAEQARGYARSHELDGMARFIDAFLVGLQLRAGHLEGTSVLPTGRRGSRPVPAGTIADHQTQAVATELAIRRGEADADDRLAELVALADRTGMITHIGAALELQVERALTSDAPLPVERFDAIERIVGPQALGAGAMAGRVAASAAVCGLPVRFSGKAPAPHAAMIARDWQGAADAFAAVGWHHDQALLLSLLDTEDALCEALDLARSLGAGPLEERVCRRMRDLRFAVPRGPLAATRANPLQLTARQLDVLRQVRDGGSNAQIADRLHISPRTVEHHVAAIFTKLGVSSRAEAVARSVDLDLT
jgi:DNA-binding CsgD family transcriptional regulator